jgi:hypothetical protein
MTGERSPAQLEEVGGMAGLVIMRGKVTEQLQWYSSIYLSLYVDSRPHNMTA